MDGARMSAVKHFTVVDLGMTMRVMRMFFNVDFAMRGAGGAAEAGAAAGAGATAGAGAMAGEGAAAGVGMGVAFMVIATCSRGDGPVSTSENNHPILFRNDCSKLCV